MLLMILSFTLTQLCVLTFFFLKASDREDLYEDQHIVNHTARVYHTVDNAPLEDRDRIVEFATGPEIRFGLSDTPLSDNQIDASLFSEELHDELREQLIYDIEYGNFLQQFWVFWFFDEDIYCINDVQSQFCFRVFSFQLSNGTWLNAEVEPSISAAIIFVPSIISALVMLAVTALVLVLGVRRVTAPLRDLSDAAEKFGRGEATALNVGDGPAELTATMKAFNVMQERLIRFVNDRTKMLAAISHDLRTPITSLRINCEFIEEEQLKRNMTSTLDEMQVMVESCLTFAKEEVLAEESKVVDLVATLEDMASESSWISFSSSLPSFDYLCHIVNLKRAFRNLLENAVKYGKRAHMHFDVSAGNVVVTIQDQGDGVPEARLADIFEPFVRLDKARNTKSGSVGLGLSIARTIIHKHGGTIAGANANPGLRMTVALPLH